MKVTNWKTTLAGLAGLLAIASKVITAGHLDFATDVPAMATAIGLLMAKDMNVTGGSVRQ